MYQALVIFELVVQLFYTQLLRSCSRCFIYSFILVVDIISDITYILSIFHIYPASSMYYYFRGVCCLQIIR